MELVLTASSPLLLYFFSDNALNAPGFELIYWYVCVQLTYPP